MHSPSRPVGPGDIFIAPEDLQAQDVACSAWNRLALATPQPDPFSSTTPWQLSFRDSMDPRPPIVLRQCEDGLIHFARHTAPSGRIVFGPIEREWFFGCNLLGPSAIELLAKLMDDLRGDAAAPFCSFAVSGLDPHGPLLPALRKRFGGRFQFRLFRGGVQCGASLEGGFDGYLARRSGNFRRNLKRARQRADEAGIGFTRHCPSSVEAAETLYARMIAVERTSWKGLSFRGMDQPSTYHFYRRMLRRLARSGDARVMLATQDGRDVGFILGGMAGGIYRGQQFSYEQASAELSIGNLLQAEQISWLCEQGATRYDMGPLDDFLMAYKFHWTELQMPIQAWVLHPR
jgi:hypothetical protein